MKRLCLLAFLAIFFLTGCPNPNDKQKINEIAWNGMKISGTDNNVEAQLNYILMGNPNVLIKLFIQSQAGTSWDALDINVPEIHRIVSLELEGTVTTIKGQELFYKDNGAFSAFTGLKEFIAPGVTTIGEKAFAGCSKLQTVRVPKATNLKTSAFYGCTSLSDLYIANVPSGSVNNAVLFGNTFSNKGPNLISIHVASINAAALTGTPWAALINEGLPAGDGESSSWGTNHKALKLVSP